MLDSEYYKTSINPWQVWRTKRIHFEPDASPAAWEHYAVVYRDTILGKKYNLEDLHFFEYHCVSGDEGHHYVDLPKKGRNNRLCALSKDNKIKPDELMRYPAVQRLSGECDFNFNEKKYPMFRKLLIRDMQNDPDALRDAIMQLDECAQMHHTLVNFSLMPVMGDLQGFKGQKKFESLEEGAFDRFDSHIVALNCFFKEDYKKESWSKCNSEIFQWLGKRTDMSPQNKNILLYYLNSFGGKEKTDGKNAMLDYCKNIYFIDDEDFINRLVEAGKKPINKGNEVVNYMNLAKEYWKKKEEAFEQIKNRMENIG